MTSSRPTQPLTGQPMRPEGRCSLAGPNGSRIPIEEPHSYSSHKGANTIFVRTCDLCGDIDWDALHEATVERVAIEASRLRADLDEARRAAGAEHGRAAALEAAHREACAARDVRDTEIERLRAENTAQAAKVNMARAELQRCMGRLEPYARQLKAAGNPEAGVPIRVAVGVLRLALERIDEAGQSALGLDQDGRGQADG